MKNDGIGYKTFRVINVIFLLLLNVTMLYPMLYVVFASLSDSGELMGHMGLLLKPLHTNLDAYRAVFTNPMIGKGYLNTLIVVVASVALSMAMTILCAFVLSRKEVAARNVFMGFVLFTMFFNGGLIPFYLTVKNVGLENSLWSLIIPYLINVYNMVIMRTSFTQVPEPLIESAKLDGANPMQILVKIVLPLSIPVLMVIILYYAVALWNSWFSAMIFLHERSKFPLQLILREILIQNDTTTMMQGVGMEDAASVGETIQYAVIVVATLPILVMYPFIQRFFTEGVMIGAVKG